MATREQFGKYLLLKKLTEDPLGETFRAAEVGAQGIETVVLLRAFNGPRLDPVRIAEELPRRAMVQQVLKSPNIGNGVDLGEVRGVPFVAYDYISGKNLADLLTQIEQQTSHLPTDHALLIAERIALALAVAYESRFQDRRTLHGFLVPQLVRISNEGEARLLGFEAGPVLRELAGRGVFEPQIATYLPPEALTGDSPSAADDVYSVGAILFELLTGSRPAGEATALASLIDRAEVAAEGTPIPPTIANLLKKSLAPREQRVPDAATWHKAISKIIIDGQHNATTFNLAFFMHNLFRAEIERETQEMEAEKTISAPGAVPEEPMAAGEVGEAGESTGELSDTTAVRQHYAAQAREARSKTGLWLGLAAAILVAVGAAFWFLRAPSEDVAPPPEPELVTQPELPPPPSEAVPPQDAEESVSEEELSEPAPPVPDPEEIQVQIQQMIEASNREMEAKLKSQYDARIRELQAQLEATQEAATQAREEARRRDTEEAATREPAATSQEDSPAAAESAEPVSAQLSEPSSQPASQPPSQPPSQPASQPASRPAELAEEPSPRTLTAPPEPVHQPEIKPPQLVREPQARYPEIARRMGKQATVLLRVLVDERGRVIDVQRLSEKVGSGLDEAAVDAARQALYKPGTRDGDPTRMWTTLRIEFRP